MRNSAGPGGNLLGGGAVGYLVHKRELGGDGVDDQGSGGVPPPGGATDHRDDSGTWVRWRVGVPLGSGGNGIRGAQT